MNICICLQVSVRVRTEERGPLAYKGGGAQCCKNLQVGLPERLYCICIPTARISACPAWESAFPPAMLEASCCFTLCPVRGASDQDTGLPRCVARCFCSLPLVQKVSFGILDEPSWHPKSDEMPAVTCSALQSSCRLTDTGLFSFPGLSYIAGSSV